VRIKLIIGPTDEAYYESDSNWPILRTVLEVLKHRAWHWRQGDGWVD
jgi:hypothetical protein